MTIEYLSLFYIRLKNMSDLVTIANTVLTEQIGHASWIPL